MTDARTSKSTTTPRADAALLDAARRLGGALEPFAGQVYFSPECHAGYEALGFAGRSMEVDGVEMPDGVAYFTSRGSLMGQVPGELVAAAFGVFNPLVVVPAVTQGWTLTDAASIELARTDGAVAALRRMLGDEPEGLDDVRQTLTAANRPIEGLVAGKPLFAGLVSQGLTGDPMTDAWRLADRLREFRGDAHVAAWTAAGLDGPQVGLLTELFWGLPMRTYVRSRAWSDADLDAAEARLEARGLVADGSFTEAGRAFRESIEARTDLAMRPVIDALGDRFDPLCERLEQWGTAIREAKGYPASGPHDLARLSAR